MKTEKRRRRQQQLIKKMKEKAEEAFSLEETNQLSETVYVFGVGVSQYSFDEMLFD